MRTTDWRSSRIGTVVLLATLAAMTIPKPGGITGHFNQITDAILIPFTFWLCWPGIRKVAKPDKRDPFRPFG